FDRIVQDLKVHRAGALVFRERFDWRGPWDEETARWHLDGRAGGSLFVTGAVAPTTIPSATDCDVALLPTEAGDTCLRWCGPPAAVVRAVVVAALTVAGRWTGARSAWFLDSHHLAPNHWFFA